ncbi:VWD domain-containing protein [Pyxidicoccus xibeiensis]|uniref:VWD domain-containing protein n=1 Tax=Pyxidicoccus xibeiensis TaxID=2906759 RepID=UPI0020A709A6|nr:VWD domain-containing protein [Pyxidicoccus xibeiensis]MCP3142795.1 VWD domain-containing protein [Pyxidicoccus xibeiensis]
MLLASSLFALSAEAVPMKVMTMGLGSGSITGTGISCTDLGGDCDEPFGSTTVTLTATPASGSTFGGWNTDADADPLSSPDCSGMTLTCTLSTSQARSVKATFNLSSGINPLVAADPSNITPEEIEAYLIDPLNNNVDSVARFVAALPLQYRQSAILMTRSESLQTGTAEHPRILLSSINAKSVFSIGPVQHSAYPGSHPDVIEYMQWDAATKNFRFHEIILKTIPAMGSIPPRTRTIEKDDVKCSSCHSTRNVLNTSDLPGTTGLPVGVIQTKNKPNWDPYDSWGGMLPFNRDRLYQGSLDTAAFRRLYNPWTWSSSHAIRSLVEQLRLQPPGVPVADRITRFQGGAGDGTPRLSFDTSPPVTLEPAPVGSVASINTAYNFDNTLLGPTSSVIRGGTFVVLYHLSQLSGGEGRGVQLFDLAGGLDGNLNQQRVADELATHRWATGNVLIDPRPVALAITKGCFTIDTPNNQVISSAGSLTFSQAFFTARHGGLGIADVFNDTTVRTKSVPRRKVDIQKFNLDRTGDLYTITTLPVVNGLVQQHGAATSAGTVTSFPRLRQEVFRRPIDEIGPDGTVMGGIFVDREIYSNTTRMALYRYFLEPLGVSVDKWSMGVRGRSRTYAFADVFNSYTSTLQSVLQANLTADPFPGLTSFTCANLIPAVNASLGTLPLASAVPTYTDVQRIFNKGCVECHGGLDYPPYVNYGTYLNLAENQVGPGVDPLAQSYGLAQPMATSLTGMLFDRITRTSEDCPGGMMPCGGPPLSAADVDTIRRWIVGGNPSTWGDPHLTTIDGVRYDFQSAGEFVLLRDPGTEIQARHTPVQTQGPVGPDAHTGLTSCVSIMTAVAVRAGPHRITYQMNPERREGLELRVDGRPVQLGTELLLPSGGRILRTPSQGGIQIETPGGTRIIITVDWWAHYQLWYMNVSVQHARATDGLLGAIAPGNWLPTLSDGTQPGSRPTSLYDRYVDLYARFGDSWRVKDSTSLFDYPAGYSTASYTLQGWPAYNASSCSIAKAPPGIPIVPALPALSMQRALELCRGVTNEVRRQQCAQDVAATGDPIFAHTFAESERVEANRNPGAVGLVSPRDFSVAPATVSFKWEPTFDPNQDAVLYRHCVWGVNTAFTFQACEAQPTQALTRTVTLESGKDYFWKVIAQDGKGGSSESKTWRMTAR